MFIAIYRRPKSSVRSFIKKAAVAHQLKLTFVDPELRDIKDDYSAFVSAFFDPELRDIEEEGRERSRLCDVTILEGGECEWTIKKNSIAWCM